MRGGIIAEIILHQGVRSGNLSSAVSWISGFLMKETPEHEKGRMYIWLDLVRFR